MRGAGEIGRPNKADLALWVLSEEAVNLGVDAAARRFLVARDSDQLLRQVAPMHGRQRTHRVVQNLLSFARQRKPQREEVDIRKVLDETLTLRDYDLKINNISVEREAPSDAQTVVADPHQIEQVFLNIINNSIDAMTGDVPPDAPKREHLFRVTVAAENDSVSIEFHDSGPGIDPEQLERISAVSRGE